jgi:hypothetical protein
MRGLITGLYEDWVRLDDSPRVFEGEDRQALTPSSRSVEPFSAHDWP